MIGRDSGIEGRWSSQQAGQHQHRNRDERCERDKSRREQDDDPREDRERRGPGNRERTSSRPGCHPLAAAEAEIDRKEMSEEGNAAAPTRSTSGAPRAASASGERPCASCTTIATGTAPFRKSSRKTSTPNFRPRTRPALVAPMLPLPAWKRSTPRSAANEITERDRANEITGDEQENGGRERRHTDQVSDASRNVRSRRALELSHFAEDIEQPLVVVLEGPTHASQASRCAASRR